MAAPTEKEKEILPKFRERLKDLGLDEEKNSDAFLLRWLRAREHSLDAAEDQLRKALDWRKEKDVDNWRNWKISEELQEILMYEILGFDADNCPVVLVSAGFWDVKKVSREYGTEKFVDFKITLHEELQSLMKGKLTREGIPVTQALFICDVKGASLAQTSLDVLEMFKADARVYEAYYPEVMKACYLINAPWFFTVFFNIFKPFLSQRSAGKMYVYDSNTSKWGPALEEVVPKEILPTCFGGLNEKSKVNDLYKNK